MVFLCVLRAPCSSGLFSRWGIDGVQGYRDIIKNGNPRISGTVEYSELLHSHKEGSLRYPVDLATHPQSSFFCVSLLHSHDIPKRPLILHIKPLHVICLFVFLSTTLDSKMLEEKDQVTLFFTHPASRTLPESWHRRKLKISPMKMMRS